MPTCPAYLHANVPYVLTCQRALRAYVLMCELQENIFLQENISLLQKELTSKDQITKTLIETQTSILESVSYQKSKNESNKLINQLESAYQSPNKMNSSKSLSSLHLLNGPPIYHRNVNTNTSGANKNSCETNKNIPEPENLQSQTQNKKQAFVGNLKNDLNIKDLKDLFSLKTTKYLKENCSIPMPINRKTGKNKGIAFVLSPDHVHDELLKLNGTEFDGKSLILKEAISPAKQCEEKRQRQCHKRPQAVVNNFPENQDTFNKPNVISGNSPTKLYFKT